jgi:hypothetical protein
VHVAAKAVQNLPLLGGIAEAMPDTDPFSNCTITKT